MQVQSKVNYKYELQQFVLVANNVSQIYLVFQYFNIHKYINMYRLINLHNHAFTKYTLCMTENACRKHFKG